MIFFVENADRPIVKLSKDLKNWNSEDIHFNNLSLNSSCKGPEKTLFISFSVQFKTLHLQVCVKQCASDDLNSRFSVESSIFVENLEADILEYLLVNQDIKVLVDRLSRSINCHINEFLIEIIKM